MFLKSTVHQTTKCSFYKILPMKNIDGGMMEWWSIIKFTRLTWTSHVVILIKPKLQYRYFFRKCFFCATKMGFPMCKKTHKNCTFGSFKDVRFSLLKRDVKWPVFSPQHPLSSPWTIVSLIPTIIDVSVLKWLKCRFLNI